MVVYGRFGAAGIERLETWLNVMPLEVIPFDEAQAAAAFGSVHDLWQGLQPEIPSQLLRLCCLCARQDLERAPSLKGDDFLATDVSPALIWGCSTPGATNSRYPPEPWPRLHIPDTDG